MFVEEEEEEEEEEESTQLPMTNDGWPTRIANRDGHPYPS